MKNQTTSYKYELKKKYNTLIVKTLLKNSFIQDNSGKITYIF